MKLNLILLPQLLCAIHTVCGSLHLSKTMAQRTQNTLVYNIRALQCSVARCLRCGGLFDDSFIAFFSTAVCQ